MEIQYTTYRINLKHSFGISRSSYDYYDIVYFYIVDGEIIGRGEAAPRLARLARCVATCMDHHPCPSRRRISRKGFQNQPCGVGLHRF